MKAWKPSKPETAVFFNSRLCYHYYAPAVLDYKLCKETRIAYETILLAINFTKNQEVNVLMESHGQRGHFLPHIISSNMFYKVYDKQVLCITVKHLSSV